MTIQCRINIHKGNNVLITVHNLDELHGNMYLVLPTIIQYMKAYNVTHHDTPINFMVDTGHGTRGVPTIKNAYDLLAIYDKKQINKVLETQIEYLKNAKYNLI